MAEEHRRLCHDWTGRVVTLSSSALTLLVALQSLYLPRAPVHLAWLELCWGLLALAVCFGLWALHGHEDHARTALKEILGRGGSSHSPGATAMLVRFDLARDAMTICFFSSMVLLAGFAVQNLPSPE